MDAKSTPQGVNIACDFTPEADVTTFMRANIIFWLLGATDGHAKNFSVFLTPGGRFHMTPVYDVLTAQPSLDAHQIDQKKFKLAMSVGKNRHYDIHSIVPRHFLQTADLAGVSLSAMRSIIEELGDTAPQVATMAINALPKSFPEQLLDSVITAIKKRSCRLATFDIGGNPD